MSRVLGSGRPAKSRPAGRLQNCNGFLGSKPLLAVSLKQLAAQRARDAEDSATQQDARLPGSGTDSAISPNTPATSRKATSLGTFPARWSAEIGEAVEWEVGNDTEPAAIWNGPSTYVQNAIGRVADVGDVQRPETSTDRERQTVAIPSGRKVPIGAKGIQRHTGYRPRRKFIAGYGYQISPHLIVDPHKDPPGRAERPDLRRAPHCRDSDSR